MPPKPEPRRKPSGGRPLPRRLFSVDSFKSSSSQADSTRETTVGISEAHSSSASEIIAPKPLKSRQATATIPEIDPFADRAQITASSPIIQAAGPPTQTGSPSTLSDFEFLPQHSKRTLSEDGDNKPSKFRLNRPAPLFSQTRANPEAGVFRSSSRARWEHVRQHVIPSSASPTPTSSEFNLPQPPGTPPSDSRPSTPKPSRLAQRFGFRHVVDNVRSNPAALNLANLSVKFTAELHNACHVAIHGVPPGLIVGPSRHRTEREGTQTSMGSTGTTPLLPFKAGFASSDTISSAASSTTNLASTASSRPQAFRPDVSGGREYKAQSPSLKLLHQVIDQYASYANEEPDTIPILPLEDDILTVLATPFETRRALRPANLEPEQRIALVAFETAVKTWPSDSPEDTMNRIHWICTAASHVASSSYLQAQLVGILYTLLFPRKQQVQFTKPKVLQSLIGSLFELRVIFKELPIGQEPGGTESHLLSDIFSRVYRGELGSLDQLEFQEQFGVAPSSLDDDSVLMAHATRSYLLHHIEFAEEDARRRFLQNALEEYWPQPNIQSQQLTPLITRILLRNITSGLQACSSTLTSLDTSEQITSTEPNRMHLIQACLRLVEKRALPELWPIPQGEDGVVDALSLTLCALLEVLSLGRALEAAQGQHHTDGRALAQRAAQLLGKLYKTEDKAKALKIAFMKALDDMIANDELDWSRTLRVADAVLSPYVEDAVKKGIVSLLLPIMNKRSIAMPPQDSRAIGRFFSEISRSHPQLFYKPLFGCAAATKEHVIVQHLRTMGMLVKLVPDFWTRDAEMIAVALVSDVGAKANPPQEGDAATKVRLGQCALLVETVFNMRLARLASAKDGKRWSSTDKALYDRGLIQFAVNLEARLGILINAKEQTSKIPSYQRALYCALFLEIRLLTRSLKPSSWLPRVISWVLQSFADQERDDLDYYGDLNLGQENGVQETISQVRTLFEQVQEHDSIMSLAGVNPLVMNASIEVTSTPKNETKREDLLQGIERGLVPSALKLFVAVFALLTPEEHASLAQGLWSKGFKSVDHTSLPAACFMLMQAAEKAPAAFSVIVKEDVASADHEARLRVVRQFATVANWRFQILAQPFIVDRSHPRPFKLARTQATFVQTDMGSGRYDRGEDTVGLKDGDTSSVPAGLRKQLTDIGWDNDDVIVDKRGYWSEAPLSLLSVAQLDRWDPEAASSGTTATNPDAGSEKDGAQLLRRKSSGGGKGGRHRPVFIPAFVRAVLLSAPLMHDSNPLVAEEATNLILSLMREDSAVLGRPLWDALSGSTEDRRFATATVRTTFHALQRMPPSMVHSIFNHLAGYLKSLRQSTDPLCLRDYGYIASLLSRTSVQVSGMSFRELKRAKFDIYLVPPGSLWFPPSVPDSSLFPKALPRGNPSNSDDLSGPLVWISMIRIAQNMAFVSFLQRNPPEAQVIRKILAPLVLPSREGVVFLKDLELVDYLPNHSDSSPLLSDADFALRSVSRTLSISYTLLVTQILRMLSPHITDKRELGIYFNSLNRILLVHGADVAVVTHVMIALMTASVRLRRLFNAGSGYTLFMPAVIKVYAEALTEADMQGRKLSKPVNSICDAIEYSIAKFFSIHQESFLFQTLDVISRMMKYREFANDWIAARIARLLLTLGHEAPVTGTLGIRGATKAEEKEALQANFEDTNSQALLTFIRRDSSTAIASRQPSTTDVAETQPSAPHAEEEYQPLSLPLGNLVKLFVTVVAHNSADSRAQQFVQLLGFLVPHLTATTITTLLGEAMEPLAGIVIARASGKTKGGSSSHSHSTSGIASEAYLQDGAETGTLGQPKAQIASDATVMRLDYLTLVMTYATGGGKLPRQAVERVSEIVRQMANGATKSTSNRLSKFLASFTSAIFRAEQLDVALATSYAEAISPIVDLFGHMIDCSGVFEALTTLGADSSLVSDIELADIIVSKFCVFGLRICSVAAAKGRLESLPCRVPVIGLIAQAVAFPSTDVLEEMEKQSASVEFLVGFVMPLMLRLKTAEEAKAESRWADGISYMHAWGRLLQYSVATAEGVLVSSPTTSKTNAMSAILRSSSKRKLSRAAAIQPALVVVVSVQMLKMIIIRSASDLSSALSDVWRRVSSFIETLVAHGSGAFASRVDHASRIMPTSPTRGDTPISPGAVPSSARSTEFNLAPPTSPIHQTAPVYATLAHPRLVDYILYTTLELFNVAPSPLSEHLRKILITKAREFTTHMPDITTFIAQHPLSVAPAPLGRPLTFPQLPTAAEHRTRPASFVENLSVDAPASTPSINLTARGSDSRTASSSHMTEPSKTVQRTVQRSSQAKQPLAIHTTNPSRPSSPTAAVPKSQYLSIPGSEPRRAVPRLTLTVPGADEIALDARGRPKSSAISPSSAAQRAKKLGQKLAARGPLGARTPSRGPLSALAPLSPTRAKADNPPLSAAPVRASSDMRSRVMRVLRTTRITDHSVVKHAYDAVRAVQLAAGEEVPPLPSWLADGARDGKARGVRMATRGELLNQIMEETRAMVREFDARAAVPVAGANMEKKGSRQDGRRTPSSDGRRTPTSSDGRRTPTGEQTPTKGGRSPTKDRRRTLVKERQKTPTKARDKTPTRGGRLTPTSDSGLSISPERLR